MSVIISHNSALEWYRATPPQVFSPAGLHGPARLDQLGTDVCSLDCVVPQSLGLHRLPLHVLAARGALHVKRGGVCVHETVLDQIPAGHLRRVSRDITIVSPELCAIQLAAHATELACTVLAYELCGLYSHFAPAVSGFYDRPPLTTVASLRIACDEFAGVKGASRLRRALRYAVDRSASPMETVVDCMLMLPTRVGGRGRVMGTPDMEVKLDDVAQRLASRKTCRLDLGWHGYGIEYDGRDHDDPLDDRRRREALAHMGYRVTAVDGGQMMRYSELERVLDLACASVPARSREGEWNVRVARDLHARLLKLTRCGLGIEAALFSPGVPKGSVRLHL